MKKEIKKEIVSFDETAFAGEMAYGYANKREAIKAIELETGEKIENSEDMRKLRVIKFMKDGEETYTWAEVCECCGRKNNGVLSWGIFN